MIWEPWDYNKPMTKAFAHDDLEIKQHFVKTARDFYENMGDSLEKELAAALLYMNVADYLAEYLVVGLTDMAKEAVSRYYLGIVSMQTPPREKLNIGNSIFHLKNYDFPKKIEILDELNAINDARKKIAHQILKTQAQKLPEIDEAVKSLVNHTEALVVLVDEVSMGLPPRTLMDKFVEAEATGEAGDEKPSSKPNNKRKAV